MERIPGATAVLHRVFEQQDFDRFAALSGDNNPIHVDPEFASRTRFGRTVCHGMLLYSTICRALSQELGPGFVQREQELMFVTPTFTGEEVAVRLEIAGLTRSKGLADIITTITRPDGSIASQGRTVVTLPGFAPAEDADRNEERAARPATDDGNPAVTHKGLTLGRSAEALRVFKEADLHEYRSLSGDTNPAFSDIPYAEARGWPAPRVPGGLLGGLFSFLLGTRLPGRGTNWLKQRLSFPAPCHAGQEIRARVEIIRLRPEKDLVNLRTTCSADGQLVCDGEALVLVRDLEYA